MAPYRRGLTEDAPWTDACHTGRPAWARADPGPEGGYQTWPPGAALLIAAEAGQGRLLLREDVLTW